MHGRLPLAALAALACLSLPASPLAAQSAQRRVVTMGHALVVDGAAVPVRSADGGYATADVVLGAPGPDGIPKKQLGPVRYEPLVVEIGLESKPMLDWIAASWRANAAPKTVTLQTTDFNRKVQGERTLANALIAETTFPVLDGSSKEIGYLTVAIPSQGVVQRAGTGAVAGAAAGDPKSQKRWLTSNFRVRLGDLPTNRVARIESFTVRSAAAPRDAIRTRGSAGAPPPRQDRFPNLVLSISEADAEKWNDWYESFVVKGNNGDAAELDGAIELLSPNMQETYATVTLSSCGIVRLAPPASDASSDKVRRLTAELYCERMTLDQGSTM